MHHHGLASHSYLICQTVYMGSGLPTRKSVLNHSMTSYFCLLYKHKLKHNQAFCRRLRWRAGTELRGNFVLTQFTNRGEPIISSRYQISNLSVRLSGFLVWPASHVHSLRINTFTCESPASHLRMISPFISWSIWMYWTLGFLPMGGRQPFWLESQVYQRWLVERVTAKGWSLNIRYLTVNKSAVFRILGKLLIQ